MTKRRKYFFGLMAMAVAAAVLWSSCGASSSSYDTAVSVSESSYGSWTEETGWDNAGDSLAVDLLPDSERKVIYTSEASIETEDYDGAIAAIRALLDEAGGYVSSTSQWGSAGDRSGEYTCRVPAEQYRTFLSGLAGTGNLYALHEYTADITTQYVDVEARLSSLEAQRDRLEELAAQAEDIDTLLSIEDKLSEVQYQLESYTAQMRSYDDQIDYSTVTISVNEVSRVSEGTTFGTRLRAAFSGSWSGFVSGVQSFVIGLIYALPGLIVLAIAAGVVFALVKRYRRRHPRPQTLSGYTQWQPAQKKDPPAEETDGK